MTATRHLRFAFFIILLMNLPSVLAAEAARSLTADSRAHWIDRHTLEWPGADPGHHFRLHYSRDASLARDEMATGGSESLELRPDPAGTAPAARFPHLAGQLRLKLEGVEPGTIPEILTGQLAVTAHDTAGKLVDSTGVQIPGVLDDLFAYDGALGVSFDGERPEFRLWAPTAQSVALLLFENSDPGAAPSRHVMQRDSRTGAWHIGGDAAWNRHYYLYEVTVYAPTTGRIETNIVTDPYSVSLAANSSRSQVVNLQDPDLMPPAWRKLRKPQLDAPEDIVIYELHVRDFSIIDGTVPLTDRGTFNAFNHRQSSGMRHLARLARAGVSHVHLLPVFDIATIEERRMDRTEPDTQALAGLAPDSQGQQSAVAAVRDRDGFNWGYDPWHYTVPEGSYATEPNGTPRIVEFRSMVSSLAQAGLRTIMDVVYNHTHAAGQDERSVLDRIVPGYYQRLDANGAVETSTCCANTATEHRMMEKLMIDSVLTWARDYRIDGFRFDLMGHHSRDNMVKLRDALDALTPERDGVDGKAVYLYGEGWNFGEVADDRRFVQARQPNMAGTGIGTFSDRLRDGVRGGAHDSDPRVQGFVNGLAVNPSRFERGNGPDLERLLDTSDWIRIGLAGDLADYELVDSAGALRRADQVDYFGAPAGYTADPQENISYVSAHDNETLFDANQSKLPRQTSMTDRLRVQTLANALVVLGQGIPFIHAGQEFLRSKSLDRDSYNSGDWFNAIDWSMEKGNWGKGLPARERNEEYWELMGPLLTDPTLVPGAADRKQTIEDFESLLRIRRSSGLFRLRTGQQIKDHVRFHNTGPGQLPGLIVMSIADPESVLKDGFSHVVTIFNARPAPVEFEIPEFSRLPFSVHPEHGDLPGISIDGANFSVPARSAVVFVSGPR
jgi:pullulanase-type alpha-1,6-glucosidase